MFTRRGSWDCFDTPSHIPYVFVVRVMNEIHIVHIAYRQRLMYMRVKQSKFTKIKTKNIFKQGVRARCAGPGSSFGAEYLKNWSTSEKITGDSYIHIDENFQLIYLYAATACKFRVHLFQSHQILCLISISTASFTIELYIIMFMNQKPNRTLSVIRFFIFIHRWRKWFIHFILYSNIFWSDFVFI